MKSDAGSPQNVPDYTQPAVVRPARRRTNHVVLGVFLVIYLAVNIIAVDRMVSEFFTPSRFIGVMGCFSLLAPVLSIAIALAVQFARKLRPFDTHVLGAFIMVIIMAALRTFSYMLEIIRSA